MRSLVLVIIVILRATTASAQTQPQATPSPDALAAAKELKAIITPEQVKETTRGDRTSVVVVRVASGALIS